MPWTRFEVMPDPSRFRHVVLVCSGSSCRKAGAKKLAKKTRGWLEKLGAARSTHIVRTQCNGLCERAPVVCLQPANVWLSRATKKSTRRAIVKHLS